MAIAVFNSMQDKYIYSIDIQNYEVSKNLYGGDELFQITVSIPDELKRIDIVTKLLGAKVEVPYNSNVWKGYVSELGFSAGTTTKYTLSLSSFGNRIRAKYTTMAINPGNELLTNRSFELLDVDNKFVDWDISDSGIAVETTDVHHANTSVSINGGAISKSLSVPVGGLYVLSLWYKNDITVTLYDSDELDGSDNPVVLFTSDYSNASWTELQIKIPVQSTTKNTRLQFSSIATGLLDLVSCKEQAELTTYTDWIDDLESQHKYGVIEKEVDFTSVISNELSAIRLRNLQPTTPSIQVAGFGSGNEVTIVCIGRNYDLNRRIITLPKLTYGITQDATTSDDTLYLDSVEELQVGDSLYVYDTNVYEYIIDSIDDVLNTVTFTDTLDVAVDAESTVYRYTVSSLISQIASDAGISLQSAEIDTVVSTEPEGNTGNSIIKSLLQSVSTDNLLYYYKIQDNQLLVVSNKYMSLNQFDYAITAIGITRFSTLVASEDIQPGYFVDSSTAILLPRFLVDTIAWMINEDNPKGTVELSLASNESRDERLWRYVLKTIKEGKHDMDLSNPRP